MARPLKRMIGSITVLVSFSLLPALVMIMGYLAVEWIRGSRPTGSLHLLLVGACISGIYVVLFIATAGLVESWRKCSISFPDIGFRRIRQSWLSMSDTLRGRDPLDRVVIAYSRDRLEHDPPDPRMGRAAQLAWVVRAVRRIANDMPEFRDELIAAEFRANALAAEAGLTGDEWRSLVERPGKLLCPGSIDRSWDL